MAVRVRGKVVRLYVRTGEVNIRLAGLPAEDTPKDGYFRLQQTHTNYNALYSLALSAAVNRLDLDIRAVDEIDPANVADISYMVIDWPE
jgi:hypothetical protein